MYATSYAKINLFLEVLSKRADSYHEVNTVLCSIDLFDSIKYVLTKKPILKLWSNREELDSSDNLIYKVAEYMQLKYRPPYGAEITLEKRVPIAAGLGGGSSNAATTILVLNRLWELNLTEREIHEIAAAFGSDINFFLIGGTALGTGRGEQIQPLEDTLLENILLVNPGLHISAKEAYSLLEGGYEPMDWAEYHPEGRLFNRLEAAVRGKYRVVDEVLRDIKAAGARQQIMSGSGSTCIGIFDDVSLMQRCQEHFERLGYWNQVVKTISREEYQSVFKA